MKCPKCNKEVKKGNKFCNFCGEKLPEKKKPDKKILFPAGIGLICILIITLFAVFMTPKETEAAKIQKKLDLGNKYLNNAEYDKAEVAFNDALKIDDKSPDAALGLAKVYNGQKKPEKAVKFLKKASNNLQTFSSGKQKVDSGKWKQKAKEYEQVYDNTSNLLLKSGKQDEAKELEKEKQNVVIVINKIIDESGEDPDSDVEETSETEDSGEYDNMLDGETEEDNEAAFAENDTETIEEEFAGTTEIELTETPTPEPTATPTPEPTATPIPEPTETPIPDTEELYGIPVATEDGTYVENEDGIPQEEEVQEEEVQEENENQIEEGNEVPAQEIPEESDYQEENIEGDPIQDIPADRTPDEILDEYVSQQLEGRRTNIDGTSVTYTYGDTYGSLASLNGILGMQKLDTDGDGIFELLAVSVNSGRLSLDIYKVNGENVEQTASLTPICEPIGNAMEEMTYGASQDLFIKNSGSGYEVGIASHCFGIDDGGGIPCTRTNIEVYQISGDGTCGLLTATTIQNGNIVFSNFDAGTASDGGKDLFISLLSQAGLSGNWISESTDTLISMDLAGNPVQDMSSVPDPLSGGLSSKESDVQDLVILNEDMSAGSGNLNIHMQDNTTLTE